MALPAVAAMLVSNRERSEMRTDVIHRQRLLMDSSGLGLLPGVALAFALAVVATGALVFESWWWTLLVLGVVLGGAACIAGIVYLITGDEDDETAAG